VVTHSLRIRAEQKAATMRLRPVTVKTIETNKRIVIVWLGYSGLTTVEWIFASQKDGTTLVSSTEASIGSSGSQVSIMMA
jgi:hypothetical protein